MAFIAAKDCTSFALMDIHCTNKEHFILKKIARSAQMLGVPCYVIGGFVRDKLLHRKTKDIDIICGPTTSNRCLYFALPQHRNFTQNLFGSWVY